MRTNTVGRDLRKSRAIPGLGVEKQKTELNQTNFATPWSNNVNIWTELLTEAWFSDLRKHVKKAPNNLRVDKCSKGRRNDPGLI